jgi:hypothetical protein
MNARTALVGTGLVVAAIVLLIVLSGGEDDNNDTTTSGNAVEKEAKGSSGGNPEADAKKPQVPTIVVREGEPVGGVQTLEYSAGEEIRFRVSSDAAEEIHVHGYDIAKDVPAGGTVTFAFPAKIDGRFEVELESRATQIAELEVNP